MAVKRNYRINFRNYGNPPAVMVSQYDENYSLTFEVYDGPLPASGLNTYAVKLVGTRADTLKYSFDGTVTGVANNVLNFTIDTTMTACAGKGVAEIVILDATNDVKFASFNLPVYVEKAAVPDDAVDADVERAQEIAEEVQEIVDTAAAEVKGEAEAWAVGQRDGEDVPSTDPAYENNAKFYAEQAAEIVEEISDVTDQVATNTNDISDLKEDLNIIDGRVTALESGGHGVSNALKTALLQIAQKVAYIDEDGQDYYDDLYDALYPPKTLVSISAVYSGGPVYVGTDVQTLKSNIIVTGHYDDLTTDTITTYTLSGSVSTVGDNTLTITVDSLTTTITVTGIIDVTYALSTPNKFPQSGDTTTTKFGDNDFPLTYNSYKIVTQLIMGSTEGHTIVVLWTLGENLFGYNNSGWYKTGGFPTAEETFVLDTENVSTITVSGITANKFTEGATLKFGHSSTGFNTAMTIYSYKIYGVDANSNETLLVDVRPTSTVGQLEDRVADTTTTAWQDTTGFSVVEV